MLINAASLKALFDGFDKSFNKGVEGAESHYRDIAMVIPSATSGNTYGWLGQFPKIREWVGDRVVKSLALHGFTVENKRFENTVSVPRTKIEDDQYGIFGPIFEEAGRTTAEHPDELVFTLLNSGFAEKCYDGKPYFAEDHPVHANESQAVAVSNMQDGAGPAWFLLDSSRAFKPLLFQERTPYQFTRLDNDGDANVFWRDEYIYGVRARANDRPDQAHTAPDGTSACTFPLARADCRRWRYRSAGRRG